MRSPIPGLLLLLAATLCPRHADAGHSYDSCTNTIASLPAIISTQGTWCLRGDLATAQASGNAITVAANNVTIDCNDFKLGGLAAGPLSQAVGIYAANRQNITVRNCNIRGFWFGIRIDGDVLSGGHVIEDNRFDGNLVRGMHVAGDGSMIRSNQVIDTAASAQVPGWVVGIVTFGSVDVVDNTISGVTAFTQAANIGHAFGLFLIGPGGSSITGNRVSALAHGSGGEAFGVYAQPVQGTPFMAVIRGNEFVGSEDLKGKGVRCESSTTNIVLKSNTFQRFLAPQDGCLYACSNFPPPPSPACSEYGAG